MDISLLEPPQASVTFKFVSLVAVACREYVNQTTTKHLVSVKKGVRLFQGTYVWLKVKAREFLKKGTTLFFFCFFKIDRNLILVKLEFSYPNVSSMNWFIRILEFHNMW